MTPWSEIDEMFYDMLEKDIHLFQYYQAADDDSDPRELAEFRAHSCLKEAATYLALNTEGGVNFTDYNEKRACFNNDLTPIEKYILASVATEMYMKRDVARLAAFTVNFVPTDLQVFSPANDRKTFMDMYAYVHNRNEELIDAYNAKDRTSLERLSLAFTADDE